MLGLHETIFLALSAVVTLLGLATALGARLEAHAMEPARLAWTHHLNRRLRATWSIVLLFAAAFLVGPGAVVLMFALGSFFALREFVSLTPTRPTDHGALVLAFYAVLPLQYLLVYLDRHALYAVFVPVYVFLALPVVMAWRREEQFLERIAKVQWGLMICVFCVSHAPAIASLEFAEPADLAEGTGTQGRGALLLLYFLMVLQASELIAIAASASVGRTPLTWDERRSREGVAIGAALATAIGTGLWWMTPFAWWQSALMSAAITGAALLGGMVLAEVKRSLGRGAVRWDDGVELSRGMLDRLAALVFAAPVFFHLTLLFFGDRLIRA